MDPGGDVVMELLVLLGIGVHGSTELTFQLFRHLTSAPRPHISFVPQAK
jgi:hypothetical protein